MPQAGQAVRRSTRAVHPLAEHTLMPSTPGGICYSALNTSTAPPLRVFLPPPVALRRELPTPPRRLPSGQQHHSPQGVKRTARAVPAVEMPQPHEPSHRLLTAGGARAFVCPEEAA